jgi:hypothetical protein
MSTFWRSLREWLTALAYRTQLGPRRELELRDFVLRH